MMEGVDFGGLAGALGPGAVALLFAFGLYLRHFHPIAPKPPAPAPATPGPVTESGDADNMKRRLGVAESKIDALAERNSLTRETLEAVRRDMDAMRNDQRDALVDINRTLGQLEGLLRADSGEPPSRRTRG